MEEDEIKKLLKEAALVLNDLEERLGGPPEQLDAAVERLDRIFLEMVSADLPTIPHPARVILPLKNPFTVH